MRIPDRNAEAKRQAAIVEYVRWTVPEILIFSVPNGGLRTKAEAARLKWTGVLAGIPDLVLVLPNGRSAFWEVKTDRGRLSFEQTVMSVRLGVLGHSYAVVRGIDDARKELEGLGIDTMEAVA